jgi:hypothetical protein
VKRSSVKVSCVPQIDGLTVEDFIKFAKAKPSLLKYLPDERGWNHLDKKWVCDILYTLDSDGINHMVLKAR